MKVLIIVSLLSSVQGFTKELPCGCIGKSIDQWMHPPNKVVRMKIRDNFVTYEYRYTNGKYCIQMVKFNKDKIITNYYEKGSCGDEARGFNHVLFSDPG